MTTFSADNITTLIFSVDQDKIGMKEVERIQREIALYRRYDGELNVWTDYAKPDELDYEPTQLTVGYARNLIDRMAAWQFESAPKVSVPPKIIDESSHMLTEGYTPSDEQQAENMRSKAKESLLTSVWDDNRMHEKLLKAAKDRCITETGVYARLHFDKRRGDMRIFFHPSIEVIAIYDPMDVDALTEVHFVAYLDEDLTKLWKLSYYLVWKGDDEGNGVYDCEIEEGVYTEVSTDDKNTKGLILTEDRVPRRSMNLDFIPVINIPTDCLTGQTRGYSELAKMLTISDEIDRKLSDYSDALRFEMFAISLLINVEEDPANPLKVAPSAKWNLGEGDENGTPDAKRLESQFKFRESIESYLDRMYEALHQISEVPSVSTSEMKTGGINDMALKLLFSAIISKTQRAWITWQSRLQTMNEYTLRYMQARQDHPNFKYDAELMRQLDGDGHSEIIFNLPLPQDKKALVEQLSEEIATSIESIKGAIVRSGKQNAEAKLMEIISERQLLRKKEDPYAGQTDNDGNFNTDDVPDNDEDLDAK